MLSEDERERILRAYYIDHLKERCQVYLCLRTAILVL